VTADIDDAAMIDYDTPDEDPIVAEVRRAREELAAKFNYDLRSILEDAMNRQNASGHTYATPTSLDAEQNKKAS
jgi:hypothetical protein